MKLGIRIAVCAVMFVLAAAMTGFTLAGLGVGRENHKAQNDSPYILGEADGLVAVYSGDDPKHPVEVTRIELASLRESDRSLIAAGLPVESPEELAQLLEDLGS